MIINGGKLVRIWKELMVCFEVLSQNSPGQSENNHKIIVSIAGKLSTSQYKPRSLLTSMV